MHIHRFADLAVSEEIGIGGNLPATEEYREFIKRLHPSQVLTGRLTTPLIEVKYSYITVRGNYRIAKKYLLMHLFHEDVDLEIKPIAYATISLVA